MFCTLSPCYGELSPCYGIVIQDDLSAKTGPGTANSPCFPAVIREHQGESGREAPLQPGLDDPAEFGPRDDDSAKTGHALAAKRSDRRFAQSHRLADVPPLRGEDVVDELLRRRAKAEGQRTGARKLSGN